MIIISTTYYCIIIVNYCFSIIIIIYCFIIILSFVNFTPKLRSTFVNFFCIFLFPCIFYIPSTSLAFFLVFSVLLCSRICSSLITTCVRVPSCMRNLDRRSHSSGIRIPRPTFAYLGTFKSNDQNPRFFLSSFLFVFLFLLLFLSWINVPPSAVRIWKACAPNRSISGTLSYQRPFSYHLHAHFPSYRSSISSTTCATNRITYNRIPDQNISFLWQGRSVAVVKTQ